jgi:GTP-binding protein
VKVHSADFIRAAHTKKDFLCDGKPEIAFVGRSNVGKSTLLNRLLGRKALARISSTPGRTRAINYFLINSKVLFVDLPGFGYAKASKADRAAWGRLIEAYFEQPDNRIHVLQLVDTKVGATPLDVQAFEFLSALGLPPTVVATKIDRVGRSRRQAAIRKITHTLSPGQQVPVVSFSAKSGEGVRDLWKEISAFLDTPPDLPTLERGIQ